VLIGLRFAELEQTRYRRHGVEGLQVRVSRVSSEFVAQAEIQGQIARHLEVVLEKPIDRALVACEEARSGPPQRAVQSIRYQIIDERFQVSVAPLTTRAR